MGHGKGSGEGSGEDTATNVAAGSGVAIGLTICFFCVGVPVIFVGAIFLAIFPSSSLWTAGLAMIILSGLFIVVGIVMVVLICTGAFSKGKVGDQGVVHTGGAMVVTNTNMQTSYGMAQPPAYYGQQQPMGHSMAQPPAYNQNAPPPYTQAGGKGHQEPEQASYPPNAPQPSTADPAYPPTGPQPGTAAPY